MSKLAAFETLFPPDGSPLIDIKNGALVLMGRNLMRGLWNRTGQGSGVIPSVTTGIVATGTTSIDSFGLTDDWNEIGIVPVNSGVQIPQLQTGQGFCIIFNKGVNALKIYPVQGVVIDALPGAYSLAINKMQLFTQWSQQQLRSMQLG